MRIREYAYTDWPSVWPIFKVVVTAGETFVYDPEWSSEEARGLEVGRALGEYVLSWAREQGYRREAVQR